jgi:hypothetical protein
MSELRTCDRQSASLLCVKQFPARTRQETRWFLELVLLILLIKRKISVPLQKISSDSLLFVLIGMSDLPILLYATISIITFTGGYRLQNEPINSIVVTNTKSHGFLLHITIQLQHSIFLQTFIAFTVTQVFLMYSFRL